MKTILTILLVNFYLLSNAQVSDVMYIPEQKTLVVSQRPHYSPVGWYVGGFFTTSFPAPFIYTTPFSIINRIGLNYVGENQKVSIMGGAFFAQEQNDLKLKPDVWFKIYPLRILTNTSKGFDFTVGVNYMDGFRMGFGLSIPTRGIY